jgi:hypothetical protein
MPKHTNPGRSIFWGSAEEPPEFLDDDDTDDGDDGLTDEDFAADDSGAGLKAYEAQLDHVHYVRHA